ncbi:phage tail tape measure protein [Xenophilus sp.]|uniref:phage tail tape measure protein n=1 Tax=Xenophilus sp. TaxID=1873499 RepID=UPI0037DCE0B7
MADMQSQIKMTADATGVETGVARAKRSIRDLGNTAQVEGKKAAAGLENISAGSGKAATKVESATRSLIGSIQRTTAAMEAGSKSSADYYRALAQQRGISTQTLEPYLKQLEQVTAKQKAAQTALAAGNAVLDKTGISAKQTSAALRGLPAQFTDIAVSLQGNQNPLTVLLQQGGQLKDMFGGIGPAARALGGYVASLITPFTLAAAGAGALAFAYYQATERSIAFNKALINTGNYVGKTAGQLEDMARAISSNIGTQGQAADALEQLAASGKIAGDNLSLLATAAVAMQREMGVAIKDSVADFVKLAEEPTKASAKLNESLHYLTEETYSRIRALEEQGRKEEAAALAETSYANAAIQRMQKVREESGYLARALTGVKEIALGMWNAVANGVASIGAQASAAQKLVDAQRKVAYLQQNGSTPQALANAQADVASLSRQALREQENAYAQGERARNESAKIAASDRLATLTKEIQSNADRRKKALKQLADDYRTLGKSTDSDEYRKAVAGINERYKDPKGPKAKAYQDDASTKMLASLKETEASLKAQLEASDKLTSSEQQRAKFVQEVADLKEKRQLTAEQKSLLASKDQILAQLDINVALEKQIQAKEKARKLDEEAKRNAEEFKRQIEAINLSIQSTAQSRADQYDRSLSAFGLGTRAREQVEAQKSIFREFERYQLQLNKQAAEKNQLGSDEYKAESQRIKDALNDALKAQEDYFAALKDKQSDWKNGANEALADYIDRIDNASERAREAITQGLDGLTDSLTDTLMGEGSGSWEDFGKNIARRLLKGFVEAEITKPLAQFLQQSLADGSSGVGSVLGSLFGGKGSGALASLLGVKDAAGATSTAAAATAQASVATSATAATTALTALATAAASAAASMGGSSLAGALSAANAIGAGGGDALGSLISSMGWADGGYTGAGGKYQPAGIVHAGEYVINAESTKRIGLNLLDKLNRRGFADGGFVNPAAIMGGDLRGPGNSTTQNINIHNHFAAGTSRETVDQAVLRMSRALQKAGRNA